MPGVAAPAEFRVVVTRDFRANARTWANMFEARILEPGIVSYADVGGPMSYLPEETIARCANTFVGKPLILVENKRGVKVHKKVTPATLEANARGYISSVYRGEDGWWWARGVVFDDEAKNAIKSVGRCSCGYHVERAGPGGEYHAIKYDETIADFSGEHLAIVDRPRYEGATIRLNSKATKDKHMSLFKWFKKPAAKADAGGQPAAGASPAEGNNDPAKAGDKNNAVGAPEDISAETEFEIPTGTEGKTEKVTLGTLIEAHNARSDGVDADAEIEIDGKPVKVSALVDSYKTNGKAPATPVGETPEQKTARENAEAAARNNGKKPSHFRVLLGARNNGLAGQVPQGGNPDSMEDRLARGNARYGSKAGAAAGKN